MRLLICDEVADISNSEQVSVVLRFVDNTRSIREEFVDLERITGEVLVTWNIVYNKQVWS